MTPSGAVLRLEQLIAFPHLQRIWAVLPHARLVGGAVRDRIIGIPAADIDLATPEVPHRVMELLQGAGIKVVPTGLEHGTVTAVVDGAGIEITTLRRDEHTDGRHAVVAWTDDWREDAARRDFTINALSCDRTGEIHDYFGGCDDLAAGRVRFVGDAAERIREDRLRILRFFRFEGRFGRGRPDAATLTALQEGASGIQRLSVERVWSEFRRILTGPRSTDMLALMAETGVLAEVLPELAAVSRPQEDRPFAVALRQFSDLVALDAPDDARLRLATLLAVPQGRCLSGGHTAASVTARLRLSRADRDWAMAVLTAPTLSPACDDVDLRRLLADIPSDVLIGRSWLDQTRPTEAASEAQGPSWRTLRSRLASLPRPVFPLAGRDLLALGVKPGAEVGILLARLRKSWLQGGCVAAHAACLAEARTQLGDLSDP